MKAFKGRNSEQGRTANLPFWPFAIAAVLTITLMALMTPVMQVIMSNKVANSFGVILLTQQSNKTKRLR
jgi:uncharacterized membrane protein YwaF